jgi:hypothetical protein
MAAKFEWTFPSVENGEEKGLNDSGVETFRGDMIVSLAREICQNSLDAPEKQKEGAAPIPVEVEFALFEMPTSDFPDIGAFRDAMDRSAAYWEKNDQASRFFAELKTVMESKTLQCLRISDKHTTGLTGVHDPEAGGTKWRSLVKSSGVSNKSGGITGGSFGIGKFAAFSCSQFRTAFYSTKTADGTKGTQGVCRLVTFRDEDGKLTTGTGYAGKSASKPLDEWWSMDSAYERDPPGTDIYIPAFIGGENFRADIVKSVLDGFLYAIWEKKLVVKIRDGNGLLELNKAWLEKAYREDDELFEEVKHLFKALRQAPSKWKTKKFGEQGEVCLSLINDKDLDKRIAMIREPGMLIFKKGNFRSHVSFTGVLIVKGELNKVLRDFENPQHNKWEEKRSPGNRKYLTEIYDFCRDAVQEIVKEDLGEEIDSGLGDVLPDVGDEGEKDNREVLDVKIKGDVNVSQKPKKRKKRRGKAQKGGTPTNSTSGSDRHDTKKETSAKTDSGTGGAAKVKRAEVGRSSFRQICQDRANGLYKLKITPDRDAPKGAVDIIAVAEINDYAAPIVSAQLADGTPLAVNGNEVSGLAFRKNEASEIYVTLDYRDYLSLEVECYEHK